MRRLLVSAPSWQGAGPCVRVTLRHASFAEAAKKRRLEAERAKLDAAKETPAPPTPNVHRAHTPVPRATFESLPAQAADAEHWGARRSAGARLPSANTEPAIFFEMPKANTPRECRNNHRWCDLCDTDIPEANWATHLTGNQHSRQLFKIRAVMLREEHNRAAPSAPPGVRMPAGHVWCTVCSVDVPQDEWPSHAATAAHVRTRDARQTYFRGVVPRTDPSKHKYWSVKPVSRQ